MMGKNWNVQLSITSMDRVTMCEARLTGKEGAGALVGEGQARTNPADENVPAIGDELAAARALSDLSHQLLHAAVKDIEEHTHEHVQRLKV
ncbi:DUF1876 domain-containing protein [Streptomyces sp. LX-29]|uniref:DUF1876 domain-containing protein n=1 Tax=unclassified Streptomyces TaxID=2593676 RepID=UPI001185E266|nr:MULTISPECIES: DUF1876 domain-containing protein [unclassified Streptomyces]TVL93831.1 hypothetical protein CD790_01990 [Streptomyces sp. SAJ15]WFB07736.1 DUF1876 domain-containing protein [Streptomyces sp. LX-29]